MKKCCVVIVTHKEALNGDDEKSFTRCLDVFSGKRDIKLVIPDSISTEYYNKYNDVLEVIKVDDKWLSSNREYNAMCCNKDFWKFFTDYEYVLIYQTDCWVFEDRLDYFIEMRYDWYGAPWAHHNDTVGNGGFSIRRVSKMIEITSKHQINWDSLWGAEDTWFCQKHKDMLNTCDLNTACNFSIENPQRKYLNLIKDVPMGMHGKSMVRFWDENGNKFRNIKKV